MKEGWTYKKLGEVCDILNGFAFKSGNYVPEGIRVIRITNVQKGYVEDYDPKYYPLETKDELSRYLLKDGDMLLSLTGNVGRVAIIEKSFLPAYLNQRVACIRIKKGKDFNLRFLFHLLYSQKFEEDCIKSAKGAAQLNMSTVWLASYLLPVPPLSEQQTIVDYLDSAFAKIDAMKANAEKALNEAKALFQASLKEMLEPKEGWEEKKLGDVGTFIRGGNFSKKDFVEDGFPCIHYGQIHTKFEVATYSHLSCVSKSMIKTERCASKGDLVIAITSEDDEGSCKCTAWMADYDAYVGGHTAIFKHGLNPLFVSYYFKAARFQKAKLEYTHGFKVVEISPKDIAKIPISYPPLSEQQTIVETLDSIKSKVDRLQENYDKISQECDPLKQALLRQVFK